MVLIDGSEFTGSAEISRIYGARFIVLDDTGTFKNQPNFYRLLADQNYLLIEQGAHVRNGYAIFERIYFDRGDGTNAASTLAHELPPRMMLQQRLGAGA